MATRTLPALLAPLALVAPAEPAASRADVVLAWGRKPSAVVAERWAASHRLPLLRLEDAFLRSIGLGETDPPLGIVVDDQGIYYDAGAPSRLEALIRRPLTEATRARAQALVAAWRAAGASKYNHARDPQVPLPDGAVLVVDQTAGDASIAFGRADAGSFRRMLEAALDEHPAAPICLKVHPGVASGRHHGHFAQLSPGAAARVTVIAGDIHPSALLRAAAAVYVVTSQMGFEALLWGRPLRCFGLPFYAGWGLGIEELALPARRGPAALEALVHAALVDYARYLDPETQQHCEVERLLEWVALQRAQRARFAPRVLALGFSRWKRPIARAFFGGSELRFLRRAVPLPAGHALALWGRRAIPKAVAVDAPVVRLEDGFLRSVGLGAELVRPLSWVMDRRGMYYDARQPSDLEDLLQHGEITPALCARAAALRERLAALGLTKYNVGQGSWSRPATGKPVVLVVGQVESDAAIAYGAPGIHTNIGLLRAVRQARPEAFVVYKPHPDVVAKLRSPGDGESGAAALCDAVVVEPTMDSVLRQVDEVHVISSLAGFEALLRGRPVVTWGCPFYAGWGLTTDQQPLPRRNRRRSLDELVAAVLILYPTYVSRVSGAFTTPERAIEELRLWRESGLPARPPWVRRAVRAFIGWTRRWREKVGTRAD